MTSKPTTKKTTSKRRFSAEEKTRAVLGLWTDRRRPSEICRELEITPALLEHWQKKAMDAILEAMEPRGSDPQKAPLPARLEKILTRQIRKEPVSKLVRRMKEVHASETKKPAAKKPSNEPTQTT